jgi:GNAT superfamily N-acetyltransferase
VLLVEATPAQQVLLDAVTASAWGQRLTLAQFLEREARLRAAPFARASLRTWLWTGDDGAVRSSCETYRVPARRGERAGHGAIVASVFTEGPLRGRGYASAMLAVVCERLRAEGTLAVGLFSEVGAALYERVGFVERPSWDVLWPAREGSLDGVSLEAAVQAPPARRAPSPQVTFELTLDQCQWHVEREQTYASLLNLPSPTQHLARAGTSTVCWAASFQTGELHVLWYQLGRRDEADALLRAARHVAFSCGLSRVRVWETEPLPTVADAERVRRTDELPMLRALDGGASDWDTVHRGSWA